MIRRHSVYHSRSVRHGVERGSHGCFANKVARVVGVDTVSVTDEGGTCLVTHRPLCYIRRSYPAFAAGI